MTEEKAVTIALKSRSYPSFLIPGMHMIPVAKMKVEKMEEVQSYLALTNHIYILLCLGHQ